MKSVVWTDVIQFIVLFAGIPLTLYMGISHAGGWQHIADTVPASHLSLPSEPGAIITLVALFLTFLLGETLVPPYVQRLLIGKNTDETSKGTLFSGLFSIPFFAVSGLIGLVALSINPDINPNYAMPYVIKEALPPLLQGIVIAAVISIVMSSADSFLNASSIAFINDILKPLKKEALGVKQELRYARMITLFVGTLSVVFALSIESVIDILIYAYNFWAPTILVPLACAILGFYVSTKRFVLGAAAGIISAIAWNALLGSPMHIDGLVVGAFANMLAFFSVEKAEAKAYIMNRAKEN
jgi:SSS family solute:Na+ symporter